MKDILKKSKENQELLIKIRRELHMNAETSQHEAETSKIIMNHLDEFKIPYKSEIGGHGIVAEIVGNEPDSLYKRFPLPEAQSVALLHLM